MGERVGMISIIADLSSSHHSDLLSYRFSGIYNRLCIKSAKRRFLVGVATVVGFKQYSSESHSPNHYDYHICLLYYLLTIPIAGWF